MRKGRLRDVLKVAISLGLTAYLFARADTAAALAVVRRADPALLALALAVYFGALMANAAKWWLVLRGQGAAVPYREVLSLSFIGLFFGNFLPSSVGVDVVRGYGLARYLARAGDAAVSVALDRLVGVLAFLSTAAFMSLLAVFSWGRTDLLPLGWAVWSVWMGMAVLLLVLLSRRLWLLVRRVSGLPVIRRGAGLLERLSGLVQAHRERPAALACAFAVGLLVVLLSNMANYLVVSAAGVGLPLAYVCLFNPMLAFAPAIVPSVGGLGVNQGAYDLLYASIGGLIERPAALGVSVLMQLIAYVSSLPGGALWLRRKQAGAKAVVLGRGVAGSGDT